MQPKTYLPIVILCLIFSIVSCKKPGDYIIHPPIVDVKLCNIKKLTDPNRQWKEATFSYNSLGYPTIILSKYTGTGSPNMIFKYDGKNRLSIYCGLYSNVYQAGEPFEFCHKYIYNKNGTVTDSLYIFGYVKDDGNPITTNTAGGKAYTNTFDIFGRIIKSAEIPFSADENTGVLITGNVGFLHTYDYDFKGNLVREEQTPGVYPYSDSLSILRTNKIWMFINHDYSVNSAIKGATFNSYGLPTSVIQTGYIAYDLVYQQSLNTSTVKIEYMCDVPSGK